MPHQIQTRKAFVVWEQEGNKFHADAFFAEDGRVESKTFTSKADLDVYLKKVDLNRAVLTRSGRKKTSMFNTWIMRSQQGQFPLVFTMIHRRKHGYYQVNVITPIDAFSLDGHFLVTYYIVKGILPRSYFKIMEGIKKGDMVSSRIIKGYKNAINLLRFNRSSRSRNQKFLHLQVRLPNTKQWLYFKRLKSGLYRLYREKKPGTRQFSTLDIGDLEEPGVQGVAIIKGFPRDLYAKFKDSPVHAREMEIQKILVEQAAIGWHEGFSVEKTEKLIKQYYNKDIIKTLLQDSKFPTTPISRVDFYITKKTKKGRGIDFIIRLIKN